MASRESGDKAGSLKRTERASVENTVRHQGDQSSLKQRPRASLCLKRAAETHSFGGSEQHYLVVYQLLENVDSQKTLGSFSPVTITALQAVQVSQETS